MGSFFYKAISLLSAKEKRHLGYLFLAMIAMAALEVTGVGSILPFMSVVADPSLIETNVYLSRLYSALGFTDKSQFMIFLGVLVLVILIVNNLSTAAVTWLIHKYTWMRNHSISKRLFRHYLYRPYDFFLTRNTSDIEKNIIDEVRVVIVGIFRPLLLVIKSSVIVIFICSFLLVLDVRLALFISIILGTAYGILFRFVNGKLKDIGVMRATANRMRFKIASEALEGIKPVKVSGREEYFVAHFGTYSKQTAVSQALKVIISQMPKYAFEVIAFGGILLIVIYLLAIDSDVKTIIPVLSLYAFAGYRLMPALQLIFTGVAEIRYTLPALDALYADYQKVYDEAIDSKSNHWTEQPVVLQESLVLKDVSFRYPGQLDYFYHEFTLEVQAYTMVGLAGSTGSGKSTLVDIMLGLLVPECGRVEVDGVSLSRQNIRQWHRNIGYVPQEIYLSDDTIARNIGFGIADKELDMEAVMNAARAADLHSFIAEQLSGGYDSIVGERGVRLSGGQRQRIGIARALYHNPDLLIFDEATSALDNRTEKSVMAAIHALSGRKTIIVIAHRLSTLRECDVIHVLENGQLKASGTYNELSETCGLFQSD
jgi:ABC-type bacteriocin/lantibiotic exporter with double-glycine peptidase domain